MLLSIWTTNLCTIATTKKTSENEHRTSRSLVQSLIFLWNRDVAERLWSRSDILSLDLWATRNSPFKPESLLFPLAERCRMTVCQSCQSPWNSLADSILILLVLLKAITRVLSKDESISHLHLSWKCLILHWLLACIYKEGSSLGKLLGLSFNGYSQPALCHYWPTLSWASSQICDIIGPFSALLHTLFLPPHYTLNHMLFSTRPIARGLTLDSTIPLFSSPIQIQA